MDQHAKTNLEMLYFGNIACVIVYTQYYWEQTQERVECQCMQRNNTIETRKKQNLVQVNWKCAPFTIVWFYNRILLD